jgi:hypothetical protein
LRIIAKLKDVMSDLVEAKLPIESHCPGIVLPDAKPDLIGVASHRGSEHFGHERSSDPFAVPRLIHVDALDFGWPRRRHTRGRGSPSELGVPNEFAAVVAYESLDARIGDLGRLHGFAIRVRAMSVHVRARIRGAEGRAKGALCKGRQTRCVCRFCSSNGGHESLQMGAWPELGNLIDGKPCVKCGQVVAPRARSTPALPLSA